MSGIELIKKERERQISEENYTEYHDSSHHSGELVQAGICYALVTDECNGGRDPFGIDFHQHNYYDKIILELFPDDWNFKPSDSIRNLTKAGALIAAEIDRLIRLEGK